MKYIKKLLLCYAALLSLLLNTPNKIQAYTHLPLKGLFKVLKTDDIGFGHSLLYSKWIENVYQYGIGQSPNKENEYKTISKGDPVADLVRTLWFRFQENFQLLPTQNIKSLKNLDPKKFGLLINFAYEFEEIKLLKDIKSKLSKYSSVKKAIKKIKLNKILGTLETKRKKILNEINQSSSQYDEKRKSYNIQYKKIKMELKKILKNIGKASKEKNFKQKMSLIKNKDELVKNQETLLENLIPSLISDLTNLSRDTKSKKEIKKIILNNLKKIAQRMKLIKRLNSLEEPTREDKSKVSKIGKLITFYNNKAKKLFEGELKDLAFLRPKIENAFNFCQKGNYPKRTVYGILWAFFFNKDLPLSNKIEAINTCLDQINEKFRNDKEKLKELYSPNFFKEFEKNLQTLNAEKQLKLMTDKYDEALHFLINMLAGKYPSIVSQGNYPYEYKKGKFSPAISNCYEAALLDLFSVLWYNGPKGYYDDSLFPKDRLNGEGFKKLRETLLYIYVADAKNIESDKYSYNVLIKKEKKKYTSLKKLQDLIKPEEINKIKIKDINTSLINRSETQQEWFNIASNIEGIEYHKGTLSKKVVSKKVCEIKPGVNNFIKFFNYFYGTKAKEVTKLGGLISTTTNRKITFKKIESKDVPNEIKINVNFPKNDFSFNMTLDLGTLHANLNVPGREEAAAGIIKKNVSNNLLKSSFKNQDKINLLLLLTSPKLLSKELKLNISMLNLIYYSFLLKKPKVKLEVIKHILELPNYLYNGVKGLLHNLIVSLPKDDDSINQKTLYYIFSSNKYQSDNTLKDKIQELIKKHGGGAIYLLIKKKDKKSIENVESLLKNNNIKKNINVNVVDCFGKSFLHFVVEKGFKNIAKLLLEFENIEPNKKFKDFQTPLSAAISKSNEDLIKLLLKHKNVIVDEEILNDSISQGNKNILKLLLESKKLKSKVNIISLIEEAKSFHENEIKNLLLTKYLKEDVKKYLIKLISEKDFIPAKNIISGELVKKYMHQDDWENVLKKAKEEQENSSKWRGRLKQLKTKKELLENLIKIINGKIEQAKKLNL